MSEQEKIRVENRRDVSQDLLDQSHARRVTSESDLEVDLRAYLDTRPGCNENYAQESADFREGWRTRGRFEQDWPGLDDLEWRLRREAYNAGVEARNARNEVSERDYELENYKLKDCIHEQSNKIRRLQDEARADCITIRNLHDDIRRLEDLPSPDHWRTKYESIARALAVLVTEALEFGDE